MRDDDGGVWLRMMKEECVHGEEDGMDSPFFVIVKYRRTSYQYKGMWSP